MLHVSFKEALSGSGLPVLYGVCGASLVLPSEDEGLQDPVVTANLLLISTDAGAYLVKLPAGPDCWIVCCFPVLLQRVDPKGISEHWL